MTLRYGVGMTVPAISDPAVEVTAAPADPRREREDWWTAWCTLPSTERDRPAADVVAEIRDED